MIGLVVVAAAGVAAGVALSRIDLASAASHYLTQRIGRKLTIASVSLRFGDPVRVELHGVTLANMAGGSQPAMITLARLKAEITPLSLIMGDPVIRQLWLDGGRVLLERGPNDQPNWKLSPTKPRPKPAARQELPSLLDAHFHDVEIDFRTIDGNMLRTRIDEARVVTEAPNKPVSFIADGSYNSIPVHADIALSPFTVLHKNAARFPVKLTLRSGTITLTLDGTASDPLNADGVQGLMVLDAPKSRELLAIAGLIDQIDMPLNVAGAFSREGGIWQLRDGAGTLDGETLKANLRMLEGKHREPDAVTVDAAFGQLDLDRLISSPAGPRKPADQTSLLVDPAPDTLLDLHVAADQLTYRTIQADRFDLKAKSRPGVLSVEQLALEIAGGSAKSRITITDRDAKAVIDFDGALTSVDVGKLSKLMGWGRMPIGGPLTSHVSGTMTGATLAEARATNRLFGIMAMAGGTIDRQLVSLASTNIVSLFGGRSGAGRLACLLIVLDLTDGKGTIAPFRIKTSDGTITGGGSYDAARDFIDMTIGTQSATTSIFALDVPVRVSGPVSDFNVAPAFGAASRKLNATGNLDDLPSDMKALAAGNGCVSR